MSCQPNRDATSGDRLLETIAEAYEYTPPQRGNTASSIAAEPYAPPIAPSLDRLPAFIQQVKDLDKLLAKLLAQTLTTNIATNTLNLEAAKDRCATQLSDQRKLRDFAEDVLVSEGDSTGIAMDVTKHAQRLLGEAYNRNVQRLEQRPFLDQRPDRVLAVNGSRCVIWEDESWNVFVHCAPQIIALANSPEGLRLKCEPKEEHGRAMMYKLAVAMSDSNTYWALLFGGDEALLFQRCLLADTGRYGLVCSEILKIDALFLTVLGMLLVPGDEPLVDVSKWAITVPDACSNNNQVLDHKILDCVTEDNQDVMLSQEATMISGISNIQVWFSIPGYVFKALQLSRSSPLNSPPPPTPPPTPLAFIYEGLEEYIDKQPGLSLSPPVLLMRERILEGATGIVFVGNIGSLRLIIKTIPPNHPGEADLRHEHHIYSTLASLQGRVLPRMFGLFEGEGWTVLVIEHCGEKVEDVHQLSLQQREVLWQHACEIHANGVKHGDLELRNVILSTSGELRIVDFAFSEVGHECKGDKCWELSRFRALLELP